MPIPVCRAPPSAAPRAPRPPVVRLVAGEADWRLELAGAIGLRASAALEHPLRVLTARRPARFVVDVRGAGALPALVIGQIACAARALQRLGATATLLGECPELARALGRDAEEPRPAPVAEGL